MSHPDNPTVVPLKIADAARALRHVFIRDLVLEAHIGIFRHEEGRTQRIRINVDLTVTDSGAPQDDRLEDVVDYHEVSLKIREIVAEGHVKLVETLAERIAAECLADQRVQVARVKIEKLEALADAASVGVEIERMRAAT